MKSKHFYIQIIAILLCLSAGAKDFNISSPDGKVNLEVKLGNQIFWSVKMDGIRVLDLSPIGIELENEHLGLNPKLLKSRVRKINETSTAVVPYKFRNITDHCNELLLIFKGNYSLRFRVYNNGAAYRIELDRNKSESVTIMD
ncbi:MAG: glycoside hydrolase family 97 N-terminal domain-containing protein, partial [Chitinophagaceae bacterium]|nr:glycoside hydrolase family 97 N-terminal domain-containing protein [Chitinophagaceae bacterium]